MSKLKLLIEKLENMTNKKVVLKEAIDVNAIIDSYPIKKNCDSIKASGVIAEDIAQMICSAYNLKSAGKVMDKMSSGFRQIYLNSDKSICVYMFVTKSGSSCIVGVKNPETWMQIRNKLREEGLIR